MGSLGTEEQAGNTHDGDLHNLEDRLKGKVLENINTCFVKPSTVTPIEKECLPLCSLDCLWMAIYSPLLCTFTLDQLHCFGSAAGVVQHLKDSLAEALVLFYPLAGRVVMKDRPPRIHCNDVGAVFTEASLDVDMAELRTDDYIPVPLLSGWAAAGLESYPVLPQMPGGLPALIIQVTHFKCGGITLAANWSHAVADGQSGLHFMKSWSELARGAHVSLIPDHRRDLVKSRDPPVPAEIVKAVAISPDAQIVASKIKEEKDLDSKASVENSPEANLEADNLETILEAKTEALKKALITTRTTEFMTDQITRMREAATNQSIHLTRADCLATHIWRTIVRARNLPSAARVRVWILVEGRKKLSLPAGYFGNVIGLVSVIATVNELLNDPFAETAALVHSGVESISGEWFQSFVDWIQMRDRGHGRGQYQLVPDWVQLPERGNGHGQLVPDPIGKGAECSISFVVRFPFYELDFGFGIPACSMVNALNAPSHENVGSVFVAPSSHGADRMVAMANLESRAMSSFLSKAHLPGREAPAHGKYRSRTDRVKCPSNVQSQLVTRSS